MVILCDTANLSTGGTAIDRTDEIHPENATIARRAARTIEVRIRTNDFEEARRSESFLEPTDLESDVYPTLDRLLRKAWERRVTVRLAAVKFSNLYPATGQEVFDFRPMNGGADFCGCLAEAPRGARRNLALAVDALRAALGPQAILRGHDLFLREQIQNGRGAGSVGESRSLETNRLHGRRRHGKMSA